MRDIEDLYNTIKEIVIGVLESEEPMSIEYGTVKTVDPLVIDMGNFTIEDDMITVTNTIQKMIDKDNLKKDDCVVCLKDAGGDDRLIIDTVEVEDDD